MRMLLLYVLIFSSVMGGEMTWRSPEAISSLGANSSFPKVAMDAAGNTVVAWIENGVVKARSQPVQGSWGSPSTLSDVGVSFVRLAMSPNGNATALWLESGVIKTASLPLNGRWGAPQILSGSGASTPQLSVDAAGNLIAIWTRGGNIESMTQLAGGKWPASVDTIVSVEAKSPYVSIGSNGTAVVVWSCLADSVRAVYAATTSVGGIWSEATMISTPGQNSDYARLDVNANGDTIVGWFRWDVVGSAYFNVICQVAVTQNGRWTSPVDISGPGVRIPADVRVGLDDQGNAVALLSMSLDGSTYALQCTYQLVGRNWENPDYLLGNNLAKCNLDFIRIFDGDYRAVFLSADPSNPSLKIYTTALCSCRYFPPSPSPLTVLSIGDANANPKVASVVRGAVRYGSVVWVHYDGVNTIVQAVSGTGRVLAPPTNLKVVQNMVDFGVFKEYENTLTWEAPPDATGCAVSRNGLYVAEISSSPWQYIDYNQDQSQGVTYGVEAFNGRYSQSSAASIVFPTP